jgi:hypothetical protein
MNNENKTDNIKFTKLHNLAAKYKDNTKVQINKKLQNLRSNLNRLNNLNNYSTSIQAENAIPSLNYIDNFNKDLTNSKFSEYKKSYMTKINYNKFIAIKTSSLINILYFCDCETIASLFHINRLLKKLITDILKQFVTLVMIKFREYYSSYLKIDRGFLICEILPKDDYMRYMKVNLVIKSQIVGKGLRDHSVTIGYASRFYCDKNSFQNVYTFDVRNDGHLAFWIMKEYSRVNIFII